MHLSEVFKYISKFRHAGHQVGRKVGDMLEVLTYAALRHDAALEQRLQIEPRLYGFADAGHKVEFAVLRDSQPDGVINGGEIRDPASIIGFVECKKVGVEQTINQTFKRIHGGRGYTFHNGEEIRFFMGRNTPHPAEIRVSFSRVDGAWQVTVTLNGVVALHDTIAGSYRLIFVRTLGGFEVIPNSGSLRDIAYPLLSCKILEISEGATTLTAILNDCLPGPQTPEKAKQASFVALDVRKLRFGQFDRRVGESEMVSILVLTEFSHWEQKSKNVVAACLDEVLVVPDQVLVEAFSEFENFFGADFYQFVSKEQYFRNPEVRRIVDAIIANANGAIFVKPGGDVPCSIRYFAGTLCVR